MELLNWARGPGLQISVAIFLLGIIVRLLEIFFLSRKKDLALARANGVLPGLRTIATRSVPPKGLWSNEIASYIFHIGFFATLLFFMPHILLLKEAAGFRWPALPNSIIDFTTILTITALVYLLLTRILDPVRRFISGPRDYIVWLITILPLVTGYLAFHRLVFPYTEMLAYHILSVELLLVLFPFTKLMHAITLFISRWYNGALAGRKGVRA
jgi:nitrate reductase gamma subunit